MQELLILDNMEQVKALSNPIRHQICNMLVEKAMTGSQIGRALDIPRQRVHYHLKNLLDAKLISLEKESLNKGMLEKYYRAVAKNISVTSLIGKDRRASEEPTIRKMKNESLKDLNVSLLELAKVDLEYTDAAEEMEYFSIPFQQKVFLTQEQEQEITEQYYTLYRHMINVSNANLETMQKDDLLPIRYTMLITPPHSPEDEIEE